MRSLLFSGTLFADYFQFYLQDEGASGDLSHAWTQQATDDCLAVADGVLGIGTVRNMDVPVSVELDSAEPNDDLSVWDQVADCSIKLPSGRLVIAGCTDYFPDAARVEVEPGTYRARIYYGQLGTVSEDGLDGDDRYKIVLWRGEPVIPRLLKRYLASE